MFRFDMYCKKCGYEHEFLLVKSDAKVNCPECEGILEKMAGGCYISTSSKTKVRENSDKPEPLLDTPFGKVYHMGQLPIEPHPVVSRVDLYGKVPDKGDARLN